MADPTYEVRFYSDSNEWHHASGREYVDPRHGPMLDYVLIGNDGKLNFDCTGQTDLYRRVPAQPMQYAIIHGDEDHPLVEKLDFNKSLVKELAAIIEETGTKVIMTAKEPTMNHVHDQTLTRCLTCSACFVSPTTICERCDPRGWHEERERWSNGAVNARAVGLDRYAMSILAILPDGKFVRVHDAINVMHGGEHKHHDDLIRDLTAMRKENTELLAENARMRRRLENKKP